MMNCQCQLGVSSFGVLLALVVFFDIILYSGGSTVFSDSEVPSSAAEDIREYCMSTEAFQASCRRNEIIMMTSAVYGRMRIGRCLVSEGQGLLSALGNNPNFFGCFVDVLPLMDKKCSGLNQCEVTGTLDQDFKKLRPCHEALKLYLEASYRCISVIEEDRTCTVSVTSSAQHLMTSHSSSTELSCGSRHQPWKLEAPAGQQINVSLMDFGSIDEDNLENRLPACYQLGYITEKTTKKNISLCSKDGRREQQIYSSNSHQLEIVYNEESINKLKSSHRNILIGIAAVGCSDVRAPEDAWMRREGQEATVGCYTSRRMWTLRCSDGQWTGVIGNCSINTDTMQIESNEPEREVLNVIHNEAIVTLAIVFLGLVACAFIVCAGFVCIKRYYAVNMKTRTKIVHGNDTSQFISDSSKKEYYT